MWPRSVLQEKAGSKSTTKEFRKSNQCFALSSPRLAAAYSGFGGMLPPKTPLGMLRSSLCG